MDFTKEISGKMSDNEEDSAEDRMMKVEALKAEKRKLKGAITRQLNELASRVAGVSGGVEPRSFEEIEEIKATLERLEKIKEKTFEILEELRTLYQELKNTEMQVKVGDEADELNERIEGEASAARRVLTSVTRNTRPVSPPSYSSNSNTSLPQRKVDSGVNNLERIRIPTFSGNKTEFQHWNATFTSCVDATAMSAQFKMLRLEACLAGEALETIKGLGYSEAAYEAAKSRLLRKYGGNRREIQCHVDELIKLKPIGEENSKELEKFADMLERAVINLQENNRAADLEAGTLYTIILEKLPEKLLSQYIRWVKENRRVESLITLKDWTAEEAEYQIQATEIKHGLKSGNSSGKFHNRRSKSFGSNRTDDKKRGTCKVCGEGHAVWNCDVFKSRKIQEKWATAKKLGLCYRCLGDDHLGGECPRSRVCNIDGCRDRHNRLLHGNRNGNNSQSRPLGTQPQETQPQGTRPQGTQSQSTQLQLARTIQGRREIQSNRDDNILSQGIREQSGGLSTEGDANTNSTSLKIQKAEKVALRTVPAILKHGKKRILVNCFLDEGSDTTYVNEDVVEELGVKGEKELITVNVANDQEVRFPSMTFTIGLESVDGSVDAKIVAQSSEKICGGMKAVDWVRIKGNWNHLQDIPFPKLANRGKIDVLLGTDNYQLMYPKREVIGGAEEPCARLCPLGWTAVGRINMENTGADHNTSLCHTFRMQQFGEVAPTVEQSDDLNALLKRFWDLETMGITPPKPVMTTDETAAWHKVSKSIKFENDHYVVAVPWRNERPSLPNNRPLAEKRLESTERKLAKNPEIAESYQKVIEEYLEKNYIRRVPPDEPTPTEEWLLPHFPVVRADRTTTKTRIVFDASAKFQGKSLNSEALPGPKLQADMFSILVRFRKELVALVGDVSQMYHQLALTLEDRPLHRFLWRNMDQSKEPEVYEFLRYVFGGCYCPFCAQYVWQKHADDHRAEYPLAAEAVKNSCYMDDLMPSVETVETAKEMRQQLTELGDKAGFHIRKWISQKPEVIMDIPEADRATKVDLEKKEFPVTKTLGVVWIVQEDKFSFSFVPPPDELVLTKRNVLKKTASIYDPFGFLTPFVVRAKMLMQEAWIEALGWDEELPDHFKMEWKRWFGELGELGAVRVLRCLKEDKELRDVTIHTFSDASEKAYAAATYVRHEYEDGTVSTRLVAAKSRLAPLKAMSIPRLELMGALTGLRLTLKICAALELPRNKATFWVDSVNVGFWVQGQSRNFKPFVSHRVGEIHDESSPDQWRYVPTKLNPADQGTRGASVQELVKDDCWWYGPPFLKRREDEWPERKFGKAPEAYKEVKSEKREQLVEKELSMNAQSYYVETVKPKSTPDPMEYSKWYRTKPKGKLEIGMSLVRVTGWINRFLANVKKPQNDRESGELNPRELNQAEEQIIRAAQQKCFPDEIRALENNKPLPSKSTLLKITPKFCGGLLRSNTRLRYSDDLPEETKFPIILPKNHIVTKLIVKYHHEREGHEMGVNFTLNHLREKYFVIQGRQQVKKCIKECAECNRRFRGCPAQQQMAPLPRIRLEMTQKPFANCATDFAGPFYTMQGRGRPRVKRYLCLFVCLQTHCCHLEMAASLETDAFLNALTRMVARRGWPKLMLSDNGSNYVGAAREIKELVDSMDQDKIQRLTSNQGIEWQFNPPEAPHFGGVFERMIKSAKRAIYAILNEADVNDEELQTVFTGAESLLNSRPLTTVSGDVNDEPVLTPNHFLIGQMGGELAPDTVDTTAVSVRRRWRRIQELIRRVWSRWMREYLPSIGSRQKWFQPSKNLTVGDVVLVIDPDAPRRDWKLGRIEAVHPGKDGLVRVVDVRTKGGVKRRPISRISPLEFEDY